MLRRCLLVVILAPGVLGRAAAADRLTSRTDSVGAQLNQWFAEGSAAGLANVQYENRDGGHSPLSSALYPGLKFYSPTEDEKRSGRDKGLAYTQRPLSTLGNCSMAAPAESGGSLARIYLSQLPAGTPFIYQSYVHNNLIIYPEHQDHDIGYNGVDGWGDLFPANHPGLLVSQGSSFSDMPFLTALLSTTAAFRPDVQEFLIEKKILIPTLNAIFRQSNKSVKTTNDYFTGIAHPVVFNADQIDEAKMITSAQLMSRLTTPPIAFVDIVAERPSRAGQDYFENASITSESLGDSPVCISRVFRSSADVYEMKLSSRRSIDTENKPLRARWQLLQGNSTAIQIEPSSDGVEATIKVRWHDDIASSSGTSIHTHRVDVGLFVSSPVADSAPAIVSLYMLPNEKRFYNKDGRLTEICYQKSNDDDGIPRSNDDPRWVSFIEWLDTKPREAALLTEEQRGAITKLGSKLIDMRYEWKRLQAKPEDKEAAAKKEASLRQAVATALAKNLPGEGKPTLRVIATQMVSRLATQPNFFLDQQAKFAPAIASDADLHTALKQLTDWGILLENGDGQFSTPRSTLGDAERYYLQCFHHALVAKLVLPSFLKRSFAPAFVDRRLTTPKAWRDVIRYDDAGQRTGWLRHVDGKVIAFTADGRMKKQIPDPDSAAVPVNYLERGGRLIFEPK